MTRQSSYTYDDLIKCGHGDLFGPGNAQLPLPNMLMLDRITSITENSGDYSKGEITAELDIKPGLWFFDCHFDGDPVMPGCLGLDAMWQLVGFYLGWLGYPGRGRALGVGEVKFTGQVLPSAETVRYQRWHPEQVIRERQDGILLELPLADDRELIMKVLQFGSQAQVIEPASLRGKIQEEILRMTELYSAAAP